MLKLIIYLSIILSLLTNPVFAAQQNTLVPPISNAKNRVTKKVFGQYITPQTSPVQPERFRGYHAGTDFEISSNEVNSDVPISAICAGKLLMKKWASGYGGVAVESCTLNKKQITVVYGHLKLASIKNKVGDKLGAGQKFAVLDKGYSTETDGERKHLHLGIHLGSSINILGYVQNMKLLSGWLNPCNYVCK